MQRRLGKHGQEVIFESKEATATANGPYIAHFPNPPPPVIFEDPDQRLSFTCYGIGDSDGKKKILVAETPRMEYSGNNFAADTLNRDVSKYVIGIYNKISNKVTLVESPHIFRLESQIKGKVEEDLSEKVTDVSDYFTRKNELIEEFAGNKSKRRLHKQLSKRVVADDGNSDVLRIAQKEGADHAVQPKQEDDFTDLPRFNLEAETPELIYLIKDLVTNAELELVDVKPVMELFLGTKEDQTTAKGYPQFVLEAVKLYKDVGNPDSNKRKRTEPNYQLLAYLKSLHGLYMRKRGNPDDMSMSGDLHFILLKKFSDKSLNSRQRMYSFSQHSMSKLLNHIIILMLHLNDFQINVELLSQDLLMEPIACAKLLKRLGCYRSRDSRRYILRAPLQLPKAMHRRIMRSRK